MVADVLVPNRRRDINNNHAGSIMRILDHVTAIKQIMFEGGREVGNPLISLLLAGSLSHRDQAPCHMIHVSASQITGNWSLPMLPERTRCQQQAAGSLELPPKEPMRDVYEFLMNECTLAGERSCVSDVYIYCGEQLLQCLYLNNTSNFTD